MSISRRHARRRRVLAKRVRHLVHMLSPGWIYTGVMRYRGGVARRLGGPIVKRMPR